MKSVPKALALLAGLAGLCASGPASAAIDWANVPGKDVVLYYPGQSNWEWVLAMNPVEMPGAPYVRQGKTCRACHEVHASKQKHQIRDAVPYGKTGYMLKVNFTQTATGGSCAQTCHLTRSYTNSAVAVEPKKTDAEPPKAP